VVCAEILPAARAFAERYGRADEPPLVGQIAAGVRLDQVSWSVLVGEILLFGATEMASLDADPATLCQLCAGAPWSEDLPRGDYQPIHQALWGTRELVFGGKYYRPQQAGLNNTSDVQRLGDFLTGIDMNTWNADCLPSLDAADRHEELAFARQSVGELNALYAKARARQAILVREIL
jgi:hypothetical protein